MSRAAVPLLRRRGYRNPFASLAVRAMAVMALIGVALAGHWFDRGGLKDNVDGEISFVDVVYFTAITVTTVGYGDIVPVSERARLFDTFVVTPIRLFIWLIFLGTAYSFFLQDRLDRIRSRRLTTMLSGHTIVCGFGPSGREAVDEFCRRGICPGTIVVIDETPEHIEAAKSFGVITVQGDPTRNSVLEAAAVARARAVVVTPGRDDTAILVVLTIRALAPGVPVAVEIAERDNEGLARGAGANTVVNPVSFGGQLLALATEGEHVREYVCDLVTGEGRVMMRQRTVNPAEVGRPLSALDGAVGLRIYRGGRTIGFWEADAGALKDGDLLIEIVPSDGDSSAG